MSGSGGALLKVTFTTAGNVGPNALVSFDAGDAGQFTTGVGGAGGAVTTLKLTDKHSFGHYRVTSGDGGTPVTGSTGGAAGLVTGVTLAGPSATFEIGGGDGGDGASIGGAGGSVDLVTGKAGILRVVGGDGGTITGAATGGAGGNVLHINATVSRFAQALIGGAGGNAPGTGTGGAGGSVTDSHIGGAIGNFAKPFGIDIDEMGGLFAGTGGTGGIQGAAGNVTGVTAAHIAAILAVNGATTSSNLTATNAVTMLKNVTAADIGADVNADTFFTLRADVGGNGFLLGTGDDIIDGAVIARTAGFDLATVKTLTFPAVLVP
jgi:hypothetical protein